MLDIREVYKKVEESERMELSYDHNQRVDTSKVESFVRELSSQINPINILKVDMDALFMWKELESVEIRTSAILTIINLLLPQFNLTDYVPYA